MNHLRWGKVFTIPKPVLKYKGLDIGGAQFMPVLPPKNPGCPIFAVAYPMPALTDAYLLSRPSMSWQILGKTGGSPSVPHLTVYKMNVRYSVPYLHWPPIFEWCVVRCGLKSGYHKDMCLKAIGLCA